MAQAKQQLPLLMRFRLLLPLGIRRILRLSTHAVQRHDPLLRESERRLRALQGAYQGQRCFIMGNGPSLNHTDLDRLGNEYVWGVNRCYLLFERIRWRPTFYTAVDTLVVPDIAADIHPLLDSLPTTQFFFPAEFYRRNVLRPDPRIIWFFQLGIDGSEGPTGYFSLDPPRYLRTPNTVTITALQLAVFMGFNPIYLVGCDTTYTIPPGTRASRAMIDPGTGEYIAGYELTSIHDNDPNHFDPRYFGKNARWHAPNVNGMLFGYEMVRRVCDALGVHVYNATVGGKLEIFPRVKYDSLF